MDDLGFDYDYNYSWPVYSEKPVATATIVTVVNTLANITTVNTIMPSDWVPPPTNAQGTQIQAVTYNSAGRDYTTTIAFPTTFINWPAYYTYEAEMYDPASRTSCSPSRTVVTTSLTGPTPQFTSGEEYNFRKGSYGDPRKLRDPKGLLAAPATVVGPGGYPLPSFGSMFPDLPALSCDNYQFGPAWGGFKTSWAITTSTKYAA
ncbi:hypothetical protein QQS21_005013 [Conoideocrella luteorostrata]|uniref:Uncharacterized protein n=1 Tax=Conoideocrella luteorostrata TaxID=1105319 RepID=A0AAJ0CQ77_9HYPO|nr:hypothetical protein QQS21_005013 [Conoideocrella luteorostrata]